MGTIRHVVLFSVTLMQKSATGSLKSYSIFLVIFTQPTKSGCLCVFSACSLPSEGIFNIIGDEFGSIFIYTVFGFLHFCRFWPLFGHFCLFWACVGFQWGLGFFGSASELKDN